MKPQMNTDEHGAAPAQPKAFSPRRPSLGAHASSVAWVSNTLHARCARSQEPAEENPSQLAKDSRLRARQEIRCAFWRERRAGRCEAPRRRRCGDIVEERQRRRCPPAAAPLRAAARRPAGCVARSLHTAAGMLVARALPAGLGASSKMYTLFPDGP